MHAQKSPLPDRDALSPSDRAAARMALRQARAQAGLNPTIDDEATLKVIAAVLGSHLEARALGRQTVSNQVDQSLEKVKKSPANPQGPPLQTLTVGDTKSGDGSSACDESGEE